ncbi:MAG: hypothetical protein SVP26_10930 [Chloroflexota bacterium]|nr:hypothetical protein [Chloroflexota bacterium]
MKYAERLFALLICATLIVCSGCYVSRQGAGTGGDYDQRTPTSTPTVTPNPSLDVYLHWIGVECDHSEDDRDSNGKAEVGLVVAVSDGTAASERRVYPYEGGCYSMGDFDLQDIGQRIFHAGSVGDCLELVIVAYDIDESDEWSEFLHAASPWVPEADVLKAILDLFPQQDDEIGYYRGKWYADEGWGAGYYENVGSGHLKVCFSIEEEGEPPMRSDTLEAPSSDKLEYTLPPGWVSESSVTYGRFLHAGEHVVGTASLTGDPPPYMEWDYTWCCEVFDALDDSIYRCHCEWNEDTSCHWDFRASHEGYFKIRVSHASYWQKRLTIDVEPGGWTRACQ